MRNLTKILILLPILFFACKNKTDKNENTNEMKTDFISRIHKTDYETDSYKLLGKTDYKKHLTDFNQINWSDEYWKEYRDLTFNFPDLEVLDEKNGKYLSISMAPNTDDTFQFSIGLGNHKENASGEIPTRTVKLYGTESENKELPKKLIQLIFDRNYEQIENELNKLFLLDEIEDLYINQ
ncbi:hypothetical protein [Aequorivita xiaoshiensis]|uniref:Lipoprotein n=1 Tax=Aequorivita xiaoshiensis TaxID=2874476 RepID=A0A9X1R4K3_9FLAO|nr:hypothetical protein [Aequorivita xiaoshiensis]MCG2432169.1 hypothetical protein [Aequorivita xiaoshiensis]